jgi:hypothetical protein
MMDTFKLLKYIERSNKFLISGEAPKFIDDCQWIDVNTVGSLAGHNVLNSAEKEKLKSLTPLDLPVTTHRFECPIENKQVTIGLYYYDLDGWILNSAAIHYIVNHDIELPDSLVEKIKALNMSE